MELMLKDYPSELEVGASMESFYNAIESQKNLFHSQVDQLRNVVVTHCKLTAVNPLSQEMVSPSTFFFTFLISTFFYSSFCRLLIVASFCFFWVKLQAAGALSIKIGENFVILFYCSNDPW